MTSHGLMISGKNAAGDTEDIKLIGDAAVPVAAPYPTPMTTAAFTALAKGTSDAGFTYLDTTLGMVMEWDGYASWPVDTSGARNVYYTNALESSLSDSDSMTIAAATVSRQVFPITSQWNWCELYVGAMTATDTLTLEVSRDGGTTYSVIDPISQLTGAQAGLSGVITDALDSRAYRYPIKGVTHLGFTKTGTAATLAIAWKTVI